MRDCFPVIPQDFGHGLTSGWVFRRRCSSGFRRSQRAEASPASSWRSCFGQIEGGAAYDDPAKRSFGYRLVRRFGMQKGRLWQNSGEAAVSGSDRRGVGLIRECE
uniref:uncharacterized protein LOC101307651 n=1 Tax=Fragaria vesca subsp. vesca TaxID=101020 RepID=UPI0005C86542|nr:PREDICTED: uncharacterized protein LOC101307651 [Fragaria vesca subsp. vesca]